MTSRIPVHLLDPSGATDGQTPQWDAAAGKVIWANGAAGLESIVSGAGSGILINTTDPQNPGISLDIEVVQDLVAAMLEQGTNVTLAYNDTTGKLVINAAGGSSGGSSGGVLLLESGASVPAGTTVGTVIFEKGGTATTWNFKGISALPSGWTRRGVATETFAADGMSTTLSSGQGYSIVPAGVDLSGAYRLELEVVSGSFASAMQGAIAADASGAGAASFAYSSPSGGLVGTISAWAYNGGFANSGGTPTHPMRLRLRKAGNIYWGSMSTNGGATWTTEASLSSTVTPTSIGFGSIFGSALAMKVGSFTFAATASGSGLRGWWNGSAIVPF